MPLGFGSGLAFGGAFAAPVVAAPAWDLSSGAGSANLVSHHRAEYGVTLASAMYGTGTTPQTTTLSGDLTNAQPVYIQIATAGQVGGTLAIHASLDENGANRVLTSFSVSSATVAIPGSGKSVTFSTGVTYNVDNIYRAAVASWDPIFGTATTAGHRLDNSTVTASPGCVYEAHGLNETRASVLMAPGMLGNQGALGAVPAGLAKAFHMFYVAEITTLPTTTNTLALFGWLSQSTPSASVIDWLVTGSTSTPASSWGVQRINTAPTTQRFNSDGTTGGLPVILTDLSPHVFELEYQGDGVTGGTVIARIDGFDFATGSWTGTTTTNRFCLGGVKPGGNASTAFQAHRGSDLAIYDAALISAVSASVRARLA